jgi:DNA-binding transcriptional LysR family regulator
MNMREIQVLSELVNYRNFAVAAKSLSYSPSAITKYVSNVEEELGVRIFARSNKSNELSLTPEGEIVIRDILKIYRNYQQLMAKLSQLKAVANKTLRIGSLARFGNKAESDIIAEFFIENSDVYIEHVKMDPRDLVTAILAGKLDAIFMSIQTDMSVDDFFPDEEELANVDLTVVEREKNIYLGISKKLLPNITSEATFADFKDFNFAFAFPMQSSKDAHIDSVNPFKKLADQNGFELKTSYFGANDSTVLKVAARKPIAVVSTSVPADYESIKFIRVSDWTSWSDMYFISLRSNNNLALKKIKDVASKYAKTRSAR